MPAHLYDTDAQQLRTLFLSGDWANYQLARTIAEGLDHPILGLFREWEQSKKSHAGNFAQQIAGLASYDWWFDGKNTPDGVVRFPRYFELFHRLRISSMTLSGRGFDLRDHRAGISALGSLKLGWTDREARRVEFDPRIVPMPVSNLDLSASHSELAIKDRLGWFASDTVRLRMAATDLDIPPSIGEMKRLWSLDIASSGALPPQVLSEYVPLLPNLRRLELAAVNLDNPDHQLRYLDRLEHLSLNVYNRRHTRFPKLSGYLLGLEMRYFEELTKLPKPVLEQSFLERLCISYCHKLRELPRRADFPMLKQLELYQIGLSPKEHLEALSAEFEGVTIRWYS